MQNHMQNIDSNRPLITQDFLAQYSTKSSLTNELSEYFIENLFERNKTEILSNNRPFSLK